nr:response regulator [Actinomycetota bacterium]
GLARPPRLLLVEQDAEERTALCDLAGGSGSVAVTSVGSLEEARSAIATETFDQVVLNPRLTGGSGLTLLEPFASGQVPVPPPVLLYTPRPLPKREQTRLQRYHKVLSIETASSHEEVADSLAESWAGAPEPTVAPRSGVHDGVRGAVRGSGDGEVATVEPEGPLTLPDCKVLVIDDDVRSVFALVSALELRQVQVLYAESAPDGIDMLKQHGDFDLVLMDIMMPGMDGYTAIRTIRSTPQFADLPVIAVSAKAMRGDREKSLAAGASDHVPKPVDIERLVELMGQLVARRTRR